MKRKEKTFVTHTLFLGLVLALELFISQSSVAAYPLYDPANPEMQLISTPADWATINNTSKRFFYVVPKNYGTTIVTLRTSGTSAKRRYILYYDPASPANNTHPALLPEGKRAVIQTLLFNDGSFWVIDRITVRNLVADKAIRFLGGYINSDNTLNRLLVEGGGGGSGQVMLQGGSHRTVIDKSVLRNPRRIPKKDSQCINVQNNPVDIKIINNEIYDCAGGDGILLYGAPGAIIGNNDIYVTPALYTDGNGNFTVTGEYAAAENAIDVKVGGTAAKPLIITNNRMWGFRKDDTNAGGTGADGEAIVLHQDSYTGTGTGKYVLIENNIIFDSVIGISIGSGATNNSIVNNLLYQFHNTGTSTNARAFRFTLDTNDTRAEIYFNTVVDIEAGGSYLQKAISSTNNDMLCNVFINGVRNTGLWPSSSISNYNALYNTLGYGEGSHSLIYPSASYSRNTSFTFNRKLLRGPASYTIPYATTSSLSPHANLCGSAGVGTRSGIGVNNYVYSRKAAGVDVTKL